MTKVRRPGDKRYRGKVKSGSGNSIAPGTNLQFQSCFAPRNISPGIHSAVPLDSFDGALLSLHFIADGVHTIEGTAVIVAPGIALAATHVISPNKQAILRGSTKFIATGISEGEVLIWEPRHVSPIDGTDITLIALEFSSRLPRENRFRHLAITTRIPSIGEPILIAGTRPRSESYAPKSPSRLRYESDLILSVGEVSQVYPVRRDSIMLPFPVFEVRCETMGAMSGGPAFDASGRLIGILSSGMSFGEGEGISNVAMLHIALGFRFRPAWLNDLYGGTGSLLELPHPVVDIDRPEALAVRYFEDGSYETTITHWS